MKLLVAIDSSASSHAAISEIGARRWPEGTMARVLNVVGSAPAYNVGSNIQPLVDSETHAANARVRSAVDRLALLGIEAYSVVIEGNLDLRS